MTSARRILSPLAAVLLGVALFAAIYVSVRNAAAQHAIVAVHGVVGSEKASFFRSGRAGGTAIRCEHRSPLGHP
jgi:hypothetical protein